MPNEDTTESPVARTISVIGSSWTCLILRDFFLHGPRRFQQLQDSHLKTWKKSESWTKVQTCWCSI